MVMKKKITQEQYWQLFQKLPDELKEEVLSEKTAKNIYDICQRNEIDDIVSEIASITGQVLLGVLPPEEFQETLEKELKIKKDTAKKVAQEINRFVFYPVKPLLEELYKIETAPPAKPTKITPPPEEKPKAPPEEKPKAPPKEDIYREPVE
jgi:replicative superfamily II helicase